MGKDIFLISMKCNVIQHLNNTTNTNKHNGKEILLQGTPHLPPDNLEQDICTNKKYSFSLTLKPFKKTNKLWTHTTSWIHRVAVVNA